MAISLNMSHKSLLQCRKVYCLADACFAVEELAIEYGCRLNMVLSGGVSSTMLYVSCGNINVVELCVVSCTSCFLHVDLYRLCLSSWAQVFGFLSLFMQYFLYSYSLFLLDYQMYAPIYQRP